MSFYRSTHINQDKDLQAYIIGLAIGDGNLSNVRKTTRLRISCDNKYPNLIKRIAKSLSILLPENSVGVIKKPPNCTDIYVYSNHLENLLGWKAKNGPKDLQNVSIPSWITKEEQYKINCLKGLLETDGSIYSDRGYKMVIFSTIINKLAKDVFKLFNSLGFKSNLYKIRQKAGHDFKYQIRLSKNVREFLDLVKPEKS